MSGRMKYQGELREEYYVFEDADVFETLVAEGNVTVRKTTTKKGKKIQAINTKDLIDQQAISGKKDHSVSHRPPSGKKWLKLPWPDGPHYHGLLLRHECWDSSGLSDVRSGRNFQESFAESSPRHERSATVLELPESKDPSSR